MDGRHVDIDNPMRNEQGRASTEDQLCERFSLNQAQELPRDCNKQINLLIFVNDVNKIKKNKILKTTFQL